MDKKIQLENTKIILEMAKIGGGLSAIVSLSNGCEFIYGILNGEFSLKSLLYMIVFFCGSYRLVLYEKKLSNNIEYQEKLLDEDETTRKRTL